MQNERPLIIPSQFLAAIAVTQFRAFAGEAISRDQCVITWQTTNREYSSGRSCCDKATNGTSQRGRIEARARAAWSSWSVSGLRVRCIADRTAAVIEEPYTAAKQRAAPTKRPQPPCVPHDDLRLSSVGWFILRRPEVAHDERSHEECGREDEHRLQAGDNACAHAHFVSQSTLQRQARISIRSGKPRCRRSSPCR